RSAVRTGVAERGRSRAELLGEGARLGARCEMCCDPGFGFGVEIAQSTFGDDPMPVLAVLRHRSIPFRREPTAMLSGRRTAECGWSIPAPRARRRGPLPGDPGRRHRSRLVGA